jgi:hypothetical protein
MNTSVDKDLNVAAEKLLEAAHAFWLEHRKRAGPRAVVWLEDASGHLVVFTRSEYRSQIMYNIQPITEEEPLSSAFEVDA